MSVRINVHMRDQAEPVSSKPLDTLTPYCDTLRFGDDLTVFVDSREHAEQLFDAVSELTMRWREQEPQSVTVDAVVAEGRFVEDDDGIFHIIASGPDAHYGMGWAKGPDIGHAYAAKCGKGEEWLWTPERDEVITSLTQDDPHCEECFA